MSTSIDDRPSGTCGVALDGDALAAYVAGRLDEDEAEAFEQHYFSCEECWALVRDATAVRAAFAAGGEEPRTARQRRTRWALLVPALGLAATATGVALFRVRNVDAPPPTGEVFRGVERTLPLDAVVDGTALRTRWAPVAGAASYELRLYDSAGRLVRASEVAAETVAVDLDLLELGGVSVPTVAALDVVALDGLGQVLLRSERITLQP